MLSSGLLPPGVPNEICMDSCSFSTLMPRIAKETQQSQNTPRLRALGLEGGGSWGGGGWMELLQPRDLVACQQRLLSPGS